MAAPDPAKLSLNGATVKKQWKMAQIIEGCARHGIRGISPWRDQVADFGLDQTARLIKTHGLTVTGLCRGGFFTAKNWLDDNRRAIAEAHVLGAQCLVLVVGGLLPESKDLSLSRSKVFDGPASIRSSRRWTSAMRWTREARKARRGSAWPSTPTTCGGIRSSSSRSGAPAKSGSSPITSATGSCPRATC
jgi:sugar phosphate isomerase/epimerase